MHDATALRYSWGFTRPERLLSDRQFLLALIAGCSISFVAGALAGEYVTSETGFLVVAFFIFVVPLCEEIVFRGVVQNYFGRKTAGVQYPARLSPANLITSLLFTLSHLVYNANLFAWLAFFPGLVFGYFRERYNSLLPGIILHSAFNSALISGWYLST